MQVNATGAVLSGPCCVFSHFHVVVHVLPSCPQLPYNQASEDDNAELRILTYNEAVETMRDDYKADLVVLVGSFPGVCGLG